MANLNIPNTPKLNPVAAAVALVLATACAPSVPTSAPTAQDDFSVEQQVADINRRNELEEKRANGSLTSDEEAELEALTKKYGCDKECMEDFIKWFNKFHEQKE